MSEVSLLAAARAPTDRGGARQRLAADYGRARSPAQPSWPRRRSSRRCASVDEVGGRDLPVVRRTAEHHLRRLRTAVEEVRVVLPREADAAVHLDVLGGDVEV